MIFAKMMELNSFLNHWMHDLLQSFVDGALPLPGVN